MRLVVFHYHDHPGGVRQVLSRGLRRFLQRESAVLDITIVLGARTDPGWQREMEELVGEVSLQWLVHPDFGYQSGGKTVLSAGAIAAFRHLLADGRTVVWAHNLSLGRNLPLLENVPQWCLAAGASLILHHHDWWWDGRWERWKDWQDRGVQSLTEALEKSVPCGRHIRHWCVNQADVDWVGLRAGSTVQWTGVPPDLDLPPGEEEREEARVWLRQQSVGRAVWVAPVRALRRKNLAEALFLLRSLQPDACLMTTGGPGSGSETDHWEQLCRSAATHQWPLLPSALQGLSPRSPRGKETGPPRRPGVRALMAVADGMVVSSLQEGFGLPVLEAGQWQVPVLWRSSVEASANLQGMGCRPVAGYDVLPVPVGSYDPVAEKQRRADRWHWIQEEWLPQEVLTAALAGEAEDPVGERHVDFGTLTLEAQLEVLASGVLPIGTVPRPDIPAWTARDRQVPWDLLELCRSGEPVPNLCSAQESLLPEVLRRFRWWREHPLLWPWNRDKP